MSYSTAWATHRRQQRLYPSLRYVADRHRAVLQEFAVDRAPGREVVFLVIPPPRVWMDCPTCWAQKQIFEPGPLGLLAVLCPQCEGREQV